MTSQKTTRFANAIKAGKAILINIDANLRQWRVIAFANGIKQYTCQLELQDDLYDVAEYITTTIAKTPRYFICRCAISEMPIHEAVAQSLRECKFKDRQSYLNANTYHAENGIVRCEYRMGNGKMASANIHYAICHDGFAYVLGFPF